MRKPSRTEVTYIVTAPTRSFVVRAPEGMRPQEVADAAFAERKSYDPLPGYGDEVKVYLATLIGDFKVGLE